MVKPVVEEVSRRYDRPSMVRDVALLFFSVLPCVAVWVLAWIGTAATEAPHRVLQQMIANERVLFTATDLMEEIQRERAITTFAAVKLPKQASLGSLQGQMQQTDNAVAAFQQALFDTTLDSDRVAAALAATATIKRIRNEADNAAADRWEVGFTAYSGVIDAILGVCQATKVAPTDRGIGKQFSKIVLIQNAREAASRLQTLLSAYDATGRTPSATGVLEVARLWAISSEFLNVAISGFGKRSEETLTKTRQSNDWRELSKAATAVITQQRSDGTHAIAPGKLAHANATAAGILAIEHDEGDILHEQLTGFYREGRAQYTGTYGWATFAVACQIIVVFLCGSNILLRRHMASVNALLAKQRADLNATLCSIQEAAIAVDAEGRVTRMNPMAEFLTGWPVVEALGKPFDEICRCLDPKTQEPISGSAGTASDGPVAVSHERAILVARDGAQHRVIRSEAAIMASDGNVRGAIHVFRDVTAECRIREKLQESEALHREMMENLPVGVVIIDPETRTIESVNPYAAAMFGLPKEQIIGHRCHAFLCPAQDGACPVCDLRQTVDNSERVMLRVNGERVPIIKSVRRIRLRDRDQLLECFLNISAYKQVEADLRRTKQDLEQHVVALRFASQALERTVPQSDPNFSI